MPFLARDSALLKRFRRGEQQALETVYWAYIDRIERVAKYGFRLAQKGLHIDGVGTEDVPDVVQETFARAFTERARLAYDGLRDYGPFLSTIARNLLADRARRRGRELPLDLAGEWDEAPPPAEEPAWASDALTEAVKSYLETATAELRGVHNERYVRCVSQEEAARVLGVSRQQLRTLEKRLRDGLADFIAKAGLSI